MAKILRIERCEQCPHYDIRGCYYGQRGTPKINPKYANPRLAPPDWCPLPDAEPEEADRA